MERPSTSAGIAIFIATLLQMDLSRPFLMHSCLIEAPSQQVGENLRPLRKMFIFYSLAVQFTTRDKMVTEKIHSAPDILKCC